ncbi:MAG: choice-of-anchor X domain-containing protein [Myxococcota bacterium]
MLSCALVASCGFDGALLTPRGFTPTPPPRVVLTGTAEPGSELSVVRPDGRVVGRATMPESGEVEIEVAAEDAAPNLEILARMGGRVGIVLAPIAPAGEFSPFGTIDAQSTAESLVAIYEIIGNAGSSLGATPPSALAGLLAKLENEPTPELSAFAAIVGDLLAQVPVDGSAPALFAPLDYRPNEAAVTDSTKLAAYRRALAAAAQGYGLEIRCDPSHLAALFTVDVSGRARDGNGTPPVIRQLPKAGQVFLGFTADESSPINDESIPRKLTPNDPSYAMRDDGQGPDEVAGDGVYSVVVTLPRGARILYKYTDGAAGEGFTGSEEWPGNARILEVEDVLSGRPDGAPDCLLVRRDTFGDEAANKNFVNINSKAKPSGGTVSFSTDLGGVELPLGPAGVRLGGLSIEDLRAGPGLTPAGVPEARENGVCVKCPAPIVLDPDDNTPPVLISAARTAVDRVLVRFSEPLDDASARDLSHWQLVDASEAPIAIAAARPSGSDVILETAPFHPRDPARLLVKNLADGSLHKNTLASGEATVAPDAVAPKIVSVRAKSLLELDPSANVEDPSIGTVIEIVLDEKPERSAASDPARFRVDGLVIKGALLLEDATPTVRLFTAPQEKAKRYSLSVVGLRDIAGNAITQEAAFSGYALYHVTFGVVPSFAFASTDGSARGLIRGEQLYLTGTPLLKARDLAGHDLSITPRGGVRTDVTGWSGFQMGPRSRAYQTPDGSTSPIWELEVLLPPGSYSYKAAHGVEGDADHPPPTLEKVYKTLVTANDATGVRVDPVTMRADNGLDYRGARLSESGDDPPRHDVLFKREAPDEVCEVSTHDVVCPFIVIGAWRDMVLDPGGRPRDYDDGLVPLSPHRPALGDYLPPRLLDVRARDSYSILMSFDEALAPPMGSLEVTVARASDGHGVVATLMDTTEVRPHQAVLRVADATPLEPGAAYLVRYRGATDRASPAHVDSHSKTASFLAPDRHVDFRPLSDRDPPKVVSVVASDLTALDVRFDERVDPATVDPSHFSVARVRGGTLSISAAELLPDHATIRLTTSRQAILEPYALSASSIADVADPPNTSGPVVVNFAGFGERIPPVIRRVRAIGPDRVLLRFDEPVDSATALDATHYTISGLNILRVEFSGDPGRRTLAFNPRSAPRIEDAVQLFTTPMAMGSHYTIAVDGVLDRSGNAAHAQANFDGVSAIPTVDVVLEVIASSTIAVAGQVPARSLSLGTLTDQREGVFVLGARAAADLLPSPGQSGPINDTLHGFPAEGLPLDGIEPKLRDDGTAPDRVAGDGVFAVLIPRVPLGTTFLWKAFAPFTVGYRDRNPSDDAAAFADAVPGPSAFADGQEFPGNENGLIVLDEGATPGVVRIRALFGDEISYKKFTGREAFVWLTGDRGP